MKTRESMVDAPSALELRTWALQCAQRADDPKCSGEDRARLLKMRASLLELADNADWLAGRRQQDATNASSGAVQALES
jgi:hypothetical protein